MVFYGGFSKGCVTCLKRRIKCDEGKPVCAKCTKSKRECLGYRDEATLAFRDEGQAAAGNAPRWRNRIRGQNRGIRQFTDAVLDTSMHGEAALCGLPTIAIVQAARAEPGSALHRAREALNTAMMASRDPKNQTLKESSHVKYGKAITSLAKDAKAGFRPQDLLVCILLLIITGTTMESGPNLAWWAAHNLAAEAIARRCGRSMGSEISSLQLVLCIRTQLIFRCSTKPEIFTDLIDDADPHLYSWSDFEKLNKNPAYPLQKILSPMPHLRYRVEEMLEQDPSPLDVSWGTEIIEQCLTVDHDLSQFQQNLPSDWKALRMRVDKSRHVPDDPDLRVLVDWAQDEEILIYKDHWVLFHQSNCVMYRTMIQAFIMRVGARLLGCTIEDIASDDVISIEPLTSIVKQARDRLLEMLDTTCRSIHQGLGLLQNSANIKAPDDLQPPTFAPIVLLRALWLVNSVIIADESHIRMVKAALRLLGNHFGIGIAKHLGRNEAMCLTPLFSTDPRHYTTSGVGPCDQAQRVPDFLAEHMRQKTP